MKITMVSGVVVEVKGEEHIIMPLEGKDGDVFDPITNDHWEAERARFIVPGVRFLTENNIIETVARIN